MNPSRFLTLSVLLLFTICSVHPAGFAQEIDYLEDEGTNLWEEQQFLDVTGEEFTTEDSQYVGEEQVKAAEAAAKRAGLPTINLAEALEQEKQLLPDNIMYGIGTGALIGGWFALVQGGTARENVRYLTVGTLFGALLGLAVGSKSIFGIQPGVAANDRDQPYPVAAKASDSGISIRPYLTVTPDKTTIDFNILF